MNGKQLFCISLLLLSIAMGIQWAKHKPKKKKKRSRPRVALKIDDLQIKDENDLDEPDENQPSTVDPEKPTENASETENLPNTQASKTFQIASGTMASGSRLIASEADPVILAFLNMRRNPFQVSPYAKLVEELRALEDVPEEEEVERKTAKLNAKFDSTIKSRGQLIAIIDSRLYREGEDFNGKKITKITRELVSLQSPNALWLIPKVGADLVIASDGSYDISDPFLEN